MTSSTSGTNDRVRSDRPDVDRSRSMSTRVQTVRLELIPLPPAAAAVLPGNRYEAERLLGATLHPEWPLRGLLDVLPLHAAASGRGLIFGIWVLVEREKKTVVGDAGFKGPPEGGVVEIGYSVTPNRRRRGYAGEAARALVDWALAQDGVDAVVAGCAPDNVASVRTLERLGFIRTGLEGDEVRWRR
jgi:ribosomal-protein-alanine N-acetyltransferase